MTCHCSVYQIFPDENRPDYFEMSIKFGTCHDGSMEKRLAEALKEQHDYYCRHTCGEEHTERCENLATILADYEAKAGK